MCAKSRFYKRKASLLIFSKNGIKIEQVVSEILGFLIWPQMANLTKIKKSVDFFLVFSL